MTQHLVSAFSLSRIDYSVFGAKHHTITASKMINAAVCLVACLDPRDPVTAVMRELHWLPINFVIKYKFCLLMHAAVNGLCLESISKVLIPISVLPAAPHCGLLHPAHFTFREMGQFTFIAQADLRAFWQFKRALKSHLCGAAYNI